MQIKLGVSISAKYGTKSPYKNVMIKPVRRLLIHVGLTLIRGMNAILIIGQGSWEENLTVAKGMIYLLQLPL